MSPYDWQDVLTWCIAVVAAGCLALRLVRLTRRLRPATAATSTACGGCGGGCGSTD